MYFKQSPGPDPAYWDRLNQVTDKTMGLEALCWDEKGKSWATCRLTTQQQDVFRNNTACVLIQKQKGNLERCRIQSNYYKKHRRLAGKRERDSVQP